MDDLNKAQDKFTAVTPPLCAHDAQAAVVSAMYEYIFSFQEAELNKRGMDLHKETPAELLEKGKDGMAAVAQTISDLTGLDTSFMSE